MWQKLLYKAYKIVKSSAQKYEYDCFRRKFNIHPSFKFNGSNILFYGDGKLTIGENSYVGQLTTIQTTKGYIVEIGTNCRISHNVRMYTTSTNPDQDFSRRNTLKKRNGNIRIGNNVWLGANVFINPGVTIGENAIVGANSVVTKDIAPFSICGGVPAKLIRFKVI